MTGMPRNFRPIIGANYTGPHLDRPALRQMPSHWELEESRRAPAWWRFWANPDRLIFALVVVILVYALFTAIRPARAADSAATTAGRAVAAIASRQKDAEPSPPAWPIRHCVGKGRTYFASSSDGRAWKVRCTGRPVRT